MTQRIFDTDNEKDMADLWNRLSEDVFVIKKQDYGPSLKYYGNNNNVISITDIIKIDFHDKTEITRPIQEATEQDIGKLCRFWNDSEYSDDLCFGILTDIREDESYGKVYLRNKEMWCGHARRLTKQEIEELI
jgi:hypothetical protein